MNTTVGHAGSDPPASDIGRAPTARVLRDAVPDTEPTRIGRYEIVARLGQGAMGVVYKARDPQLGRLVALKTLRRDLGLPPENYADLKTRFHQEAIAAGRLNHPGIAAIHDVIDLDGVPYIVMEYLEGRTLAAILAADGPLDPPRAVRHAVELCHALEYAHTRGVVHRDIKPANIIVTTSGVAKVTDFGIARIAGSEVTQTGVMLGTPAYMSPEQLHGAVDPRSDLFALGLVLYESLTGVNPFANDDLAAVLYQIAHVEPAPIRTRNPSVSAMLDAVIARVLAKRPDERYESAKALAEALTRTVSPTWHHLIQPRRLRPRRRTVLVAVAALLVSSVGGWAVWDRWTRDIARKAQNAGTPEVSVTSPPAGSSDSPAATAASRRSPPPEPTRSRPAPAAIGSVTITTNPSVDVFIDGAFKGRTDTTPLVLAEVPVGERRVILRLGAREHTLKARVRDGRPVTLKYQFPEAVESPDVARPREAPADTPTSPTPAVSSGASACLSVNAVPFASIYVDGQYRGDTPKACLRVPVGDRRIQFETNGERSPERVLQVTERDTAAAPLRLSYDFKTHRFLEP